MSDGHEEEWRPVVGFDGYEVSSLGRVRSLLTGNILRTKASTYNGYVMLGLRAPEGARSMRLHVIVARAFIPNPLGKQQVNHIDANRLNNAASNLDWVTAKENRRDAVERGTSGAASNPHFRFKLSADDIEKIKVRLAAGESQAAIARDYKVNNSHISRISRGVSWRHSHLPAAKLAPEDMREQCARIVEGYALGCVTKPMCAQIAADIRALDATWAKQPAAPSGNSGERP